MLLEVDADLFQRCQPPGYEVRWLTPLPLQTRYPAVMFSPRRTDNSRLVAVDMDVICLRAIQSYCCVTSGSLDVADNGIYDLLPIEVSAHAFFPLGMACLFIAVSLIAQVRKRSRMAIAANVPSWPFSA